MPDLNGQVAVVTGGNRGIGFAIADALAESGASIALWSRDAQRNQGAVEELKRHGGQVVASECDVSCEDDVTDSMRRTVDQLGRVDVFVANAGTPAAGGAFVDTSLDEWRRVFAVNCDGAFLGLRAAAKQMLLQGEGGSLIGISSVGALQGAARHEAYSASKAALLALIRGLAVELARDQIRSNALLPGWVDTEMSAEARKFEKFVSVTTSRTPARRWALPDDLRAAALFLADKSLAFHTGTSLIVDGGYSIA